MPTQTGYKGFHIYRSIKYHPIKDDTADTKNVLVLLTVFLVSPPNHHDILRMLSIALVKSQFLPGLGHRM